jgi:cytochrome oxidase assembly protein ShyY1
MKYSFKRKIIYTLFSSPFAFLTFKAFQWQTRRKAEKIEEIEHRIKQLNNPPIKLTDELIKEIESNDNNKSLWEFKPLELNGSFIKTNNNAKIIKISKTKEAEPGYQILKPFCYDKIKLSKNDIYKYKCIIVDRGWVPLDFKIDDDEYDTRNYKKVQGVVYYGDIKNNFSKSGLDGKWITISPNELANYLNDEQIEVNNKFIIKQVDFDANDNKNSSPYPMILKKNDLLIWTISPERHQDYANFWRAATIFNIISNGIVWIVL